MLLEFPGNSDSSGSAPPAGIRKKATGIGLYLARQRADDLKLKLNAASRWGEGGSISITFPDVSSRRLCEIYHHTQQRPEKILSGRCCFTFGSAPAVSVR